jgi:hypothetical protein
VSQLRALIGVDEIYLTTTKFREAAADTNVQEVLRKWRYNSPGHQIQKGDGGAIERDGDVHRVLRELDAAVRAQAGDVLAGRVLFLVQLVRQGCGERGFHTNPVCNSGDVICGVTVGHVSRKIAFRMSAQVFATRGEGAHDGGFGASIFYQSSIQYLSTTLVHAEIRRHGTPPTGMLDVLCLCVTCRGRHSKNPFSKILDVVSIPEFAQDHESALRSDVGPVVLCDFSKLRFRKLTYDF